jgi:hypothetical protein
MSQLTPDFWPANAAKLIDPNSIIGAVGPTMSFYYFTVVIFFSGRADGLETLPCTTNRKWVADVDLFLTGNGRNMPLHFDSKAKPGTST